MSKDDALFQRQWADNMTTALESHKEMIDALLARVSELEKWAFDKQNKEALVKEFSRVKPNAAKEH